MTRAAATLAAVAAVALVVTGCASSKNADTVSAPPAAGGLSAGGTDNSVSAIGPAVAFDGVTVDGATDTKNKPKVSSKGTGDPATIETKDLVLGTGAQASATSTVTVQYVGVTYADGTQFDSSWDRGQGGASFSLQQVVPGFTQGIGGTSGVAGMKVGGRRIMILPSALAYGPSGQPQAGIAPNTPLVFVVDLLVVT